jgi:hypothetical protein
MQSRSGAAAEPAPSAGSELDGLLDRLVAELRATQLRLAAARPER